MVPAAGESRCGGILAADCASGEEFEEAGCGGGGDAGAELDVFLEEGGEEGGAEGGGECAAFGGLAAAVVGGVVEDAV